MPPCRGSWTMRNRRPARSVRTADRDAIDATARQKRNERTPAYEDLLRPCNAQSRSWPVETRQGRVARRGIRGLPATLGFAGRSTPDPTRATESAGCNRQEALHRAQLDVQQPKGGSTVVGTGGLGPAAANVPCGGGAGCGRASVAGAASILMPGALQFTMSRRRRVSVVRDGQTGSSGPGESDEAWPGSALRAVPGGLVRRSSRSVKAANRATRPRWPAAHGGHVLASGTGDRD